MNDSCFANNIRIFIYGNILVLYMQTINRSYFSLHMVCYYDDTDNTTAIFFRGKKRGRDLFSMNTNFPNNIRIQIRKLSLVFYRHFSLHSFWFKLLHFRVWMMLIYNICLSASLVKCPKWPSGTLKFFWLNWACRISLWYLYRLIEAKVY